MLLSLAVDLVGQALQAIITKVMFDFAFSNRDIQLFVILVVVGLEIFLLSTINDAIRQYLQLYIAQDLAFSLRSRFVRHLISLPMSFFTSRSTGEQLFRLDSDVVNTAKFVGGFPSTATSVTFVWYFRCSLFYGWIALCIVCPSSRDGLLVCIQVLFRLRRKLSQQQATEQQLVSSQLADRIPQIKLVKAYGCERREIRQYLSNQIKLIRLAYFQYWLGLKESTT